MEEGSGQDGWRPDEKRFGDYEVLLDPRGGPWVLGSGSYGRTYKARNVELGTEVAIKVIRLEVTASESVRQRFLSEGRALADLAHENIAMLRHFGRTADGQLYYAMDYCAGGTLAERVKRLGPRPPGEALEIVRQAASALAAAHAKGIIHRDLKPGNIMLGQASPLRVKVIDFGLAQAAGAEASVERFHGTAQWASPEQLREDSLDGRSDLFSLGLVLWFLLDGEPPDQGSMREVVQARLAPGGYAARLPQGIPGGIAKLLARLLEADPARRPASAAELLDDLDDLCRRDPYEPLAGPDEEGTEEIDISALPRMAGDTPVEGRYVRLTRLHSDLAGDWYEAELKDGQGTRLLFVLDENWSKDPGLRDKLRMNLARLWRRPIDGLPRFAAFQESDSGLVAEWEGASGRDLASWLKQQKRKVDLRGVIDFLGEVAQIADEVAARGLPGVGLMSTQVRWQGSGGGDDGEALRSAAPCLFPLLLDAPDLPVAETPAMDAGGSTLVLVGPELSCDRCFMMAKLIYRIVAGREPADAVVHSRDAYVAVSGFSEKGNEMLCDALGCRKSWESCLHLVRSLAGADALSVSSSGTGRVSMSRDSSRTSQTMQRSQDRPLPDFAFSAEPSADVAASRLPLPPSLPPAPGQVVAAGDSRTGTSGSTAAVTPVSLPRAPAAGGRGKWFAVAAVAAVVLLSIAAVAWKLWPRPPRPLVDKPTVSVPPRENPPPKDDPVVVEPKPPVRADPPVRQSTSLVRVPEQAASVVQAVALCEDGGTIEISGGVYREAVAITKSLTIRASNGAALEAGESAPCPLTIKGKGKADIHGLTIRDTGKQASADMENCPPLILVTNGTSLELEQCDVEGSQGNGIVVMAKSQATVNSCRISRNSDCGLEVNSGGTAEIVRTSLLENRIGISVSGATTTARMSSASIVSRSSINGVEIHDGARFSIAASEVSSTQERAGIFATGRETKLLASAKTSVLDNGTHGIKLENLASIELAQCKIEGNRESGILADDGGELSVTGCSFENTLTGMVINGASKLTVRGSEFRKHSEIGLACMKVPLVVEGNEFLDNQDAILVAEGASGNISNNRTSPKPPADTIIVEAGSGNIVQQNNTLKK